MYHKICIENIVNRGTYGVVYAAKLFDKTCAIKRGNPKPGASSHHIRNEQRAYEILASSPNYARFTPEIYKCDQNCIIMEKFDLNVEQYLILQSVEKPRLHLFIRQILQALEFLHSKNLSHGDIKTSNMLVNLSNPVIKLSDFGLVRSFVDKDGTHVSYSPGIVAPHKGTLMFISEDSHRGVIPSRRSDLENLGWVLIHSFYGARPSRWRHSKAGPKGQAESSLFGDPTTNSRRAERCTEPRVRAMKGKQLILNQKIKIKHLILTLGIKQIVKYCTTNRLENYFQYILKLSYTEQPNYKALIDIFS